MCRAAVELIKTGSAAVHRLKILKILYRMTERNIQNDSIGKSFQNLLKYPENGAILQSQGEQRKA